MFLFSSMFLVQRRLYTLGSRAKLLKTIYSLNTLGFSTSAVGIAYCRQTNLLYVFSHTYNMVKKNWLKKRCKFPWTFSRFTNLVEWGNLLCGLKEPVSSVTRTLVLWACLPVALYVGHSYFMFTKKLSLECEFLYATNEKVESCQVYSSLCPALPCWSMSSFCLAKAITLTSSTEVQAEGLQFISVSRSWSLCGLKNPFMGVTCQIVIIHNSIKITVMK